MGTSEGGAMDDALIRTTLPTPDPKFGTHGAINEGLPRSQTLVQYIHARVPEVRMRVPVAFPHLDLEAASQEPTRMVEQSHVACNSYTTTTVSAQKRLLGDVRETSIPQLRAHSSLPWYAIRRKHALVSCYVSPPSR
jgi:hypothetical protein